jgi:hypothetical protein
VTCVVWAARVAPARRGLAPVIGVSLLVAAFGVARRLDTHLDDTAWRADAVLAWVREHAHGGERVGVAGLWPTAGVEPFLPAFGQRLDNHVVYVGPFVRHMLRQYTTSTAFLAGLRHERIDLLVLGRGFPRLVAQTREERWVRAAGMRLVAQSPRLSPYVPD